MKYMLLIYNAPDALPQMTAAESQAWMGKWFTYTDELAKAGALISGEPLQGVDVATTVRLRDGKRLVTDGPFAETKEHLMGFYLIDVLNLDDALAWAAKVPSSTLGSIEVRPLQEMPGS